MASKYFIAVRPGTGAINVDDLVRKLRALYPTFEDFGVDEFGSREWAIGNAGQFPVRGKFGADDGSAVLEGNLRSVAPVAIAVRRLVPPSTALEMCDEEYTWSTELGTALAAEDIIGME